MLQLGILFIVVAVLMPTSVFAHRVNVLVLDSSDRPVSDAEVELVSIQGGTSKSKAIFLTTDEDGEANGTISQGLRLNTKVTKAEHYTSRRTDQIAGSESRVVVRLRPIVAPIAMYAKSVRMIMPGLNTRYGFDLSVGDWVAPNGDGRSEDMFFEMSVERTSKTEFVQTLFIKFDQEGEGIREYSLDSGIHQSDYPYIYQAPDAGFNEFAKYEVLRSNGERVEEQLSNHFSVIKIRSPSAAGEDQDFRYGKIYPAIRLIRGQTDSPGFKMTYYFNPNLGDKNLEFDQAQNLFGRLSRREAVSKP